jgi:hypothetical protein
MLMESGQQSGVVLTPRIFGFVLTEGFGNVVTGDPINKVPNFPRPLVTKLSHVQRVSELQKPNVRLT